MLMVDKTVEVKKTDPVKEHCPECDGERSCDVQAQKMTACKTTAGVKI